MIPFALSFLNPALLTGLGLVSVPLVIHILNRRRFRVVRWAAMEFLLRAFKENRRRVRFEQLLLLLLRMALVALLAFLLARPQASSDDLLGLTRGTVHHVVLLDDSGSMGEVSGSGTNMDVAKQHVERVVEELARLTSGDVFTLLRTSSAKPDFFGRPTTLALAGEVERFLESVRPTPGRLLLHETLDRATELVRKYGKDKAERLTVYLVSDLRRADLLGAQGRLREEIVEKLARLSPDRFFVMPAGRTAGENLAIVGLERRNARSVKDHPSSFEVVVENQGARASGEVELGFAVDGRSRVQRKVPGLAPGERHSEVFRTKFARVGSHFVEADIPKDRIHVDDRRALAFPVAQSSRVLLVDGDAGENVETSETYYLGIALDPTEDGASGLSVSKVDESDIGDSDLDGFDLIVLANVNRIDETTLDELEAWVAAGGGLVFTAGDQVEVRTWNDSFWKHGQGLLPAPLVEELGGDLDKPESIVLPKGDAAAGVEGESLFGESAAQLGLMLGQVLVGRYLRVSKVAGAGAADVVPDETSILLRAGDENGPPLLLRKTFGSGQVALSTTTADAAWTSWPGDPTYLVVQSMLAESLLRREDLGPQNPGARGVVERRLPAAEYRLDARLLPAVERAGSETEERAFAAAPDETKPDELVFDVAPEEGRPWPAAGPYRILFERADGEEEAYYFAVAPWEREGVPSAFDERGFKAALPRDILEKTEWVELRQAQAGFLTEEGEIWRVLAFALIGFMLVETLLAWRFGRH